MIRFLKSVELWTAIVMMVVLSFCLGNGDFIAGFSNLANVKQNLEWIAWAYVIYRLHLHHKHISSLLGGGENDERHRDS
jgi:hypothetical protein